MKWQLKFNDDVDKVVEIKKNYQFLKVLLKKHIKQD